MRRRSKSFAVLSVAVLGLLCSAAHAQSNEWAWMGGSSTAGNFSSYGTIGTPGDGSVPGGRTGPVSWKDQKGNFWLFGGAGFDSVGNTEYLNDLWEFNPSTRQWTWMNGSSAPEKLGVQPGVYGTLGTPAAGNVPSGRSGAVGWVDTKGNLWLFGGSSYSNDGISGSLNDLWEYIPSTNQWAWMGGANTANLSGVYGTLGTPVPGNAPGARVNAVSMTDAKGNFWLFGGAGYDSTGGQGNLSDLWKFNPATDQWTWVSGASIANQASEPGILQTPAAGNVPASRNSAVGWVDSNQNLWIFGGVGIGSPGSPIGIVLNDLWKFNPATNEWTWMSGAARSQAGQSGVYGTLQTPAAGNVPGSRTGALSWTDSKGNLWLFGGVGFDTTKYESYLNDLWEFSPTLGQWAWMGGVNTVPPEDCSPVANWCGQFGQYGTLQTPALGNMPGGRYYSTGWTDSKGNFWLFGGLGYDAQVNFGYLSDLWEFEPNTGNQSVTASPEISPGSGSYMSWQTVTISDATPGAVIHYTINGSLPALEYSVPIQVSASETIEAIASASGYANSNIATANYVEDLPQATAPTFSLAPGTYPNPQTVTITNTTPGATIYYAIGAVPTTASAVYSGPITVSSPETLEAIAVADDYLNSNVATAAYNIGSNSLAEWTWMGGSSTIPAQCSPALECGQPGWYGTYQTFAPANIPAGRSAAVTWTDSNGNLWLFAGQGSQATLNDLWEYNLSIGEWAWIAGSGTAAASHPGVYGTLGTAAASNTPGSRQQAVGWTDSKGNLWLFGGYGLDADGNTGDLNDLWKFSPSLKQWTWMGGDSTLVCIAKNECSGRPGVYGTLGTASTTNMPGGHHGASSWIDRNGNFWLYGGEGVDSRGIQCFPDDFWEFRPTMNEWTWMGGNKFCANIGTGYTGGYSNVGVPAIQNKPSSVLNTTSWIDSSGKLWLFGGLGEDTTGTGYTLNDMWKFDPSINEWAFTSQYSAGGSGKGFGNYGTLGNWSPTNIPSERDSAAGWTDSDGNFWLLGGYGLTSSFPAGVLNDLWEFKPSLNEWSWRSGSNTITCVSSGNSICVTNGRLGSYGALGTPSPGNVPGSRIFANTWTDHNGNLWLFGGQGLDSQGRDGFLNDMWQYGLKGAPASANAFPPAAAPTFSLTAGDYPSPQNLSISDQTPGSTIYYTIDRTAPTANSSVYKAPVSVLSSETVEAIAIADNYSASPVTVASYTIDNPQVATPSFSLPAGTYTSTQMVILSDVTTGAAIYYTTDGTDPTSASTVYNGAITVSATETLKAIAIAAGYANSAIASAAYTISPPPTFTLQASSTSLTLSPGSPGKVTLTVAPKYGFSSSVTFACSGLPIGATCSFSPSSVATSGGLATTVLTISADSQSATAVDSSRPYLQVMTLALTFFFFNWRRRKLQHGLFLVLALIGLGLASGCGGTGTGNGNNGGGSNPVTSIVTITATAGQVQQTVPVSIMVE